LYILYIGDFMKAIIYSKYDWHKLWGRIKEGHPPSINISWICKKRVWVHGTRTL